MAPSPTTHHRARTRRVRSGVALALAVALALPVAGPVAAQSAPASTPTVRSTVPGEGEGPVDLEAAAKALEETLAAAPETPASPSPDDPFVEFVTATQASSEASLVLWDATRSADAARARAFQTKAAEIAAIAAKDRAAAARDAARRELTAERGRLSDLTVRAYVTGGDVGIEQYRAIMQGDTTDPAAGRQILFVHVLERQKQVTMAAERSLSLARRRLEAARRRVDRSTRAATAAAKVGTDRLEVQAKAQAALDAASARLVAAGSDLRGQGGRAVQVVPQDVALIGLPRLSAEDLAGWFAAGPYRPRVATPIEDYARWFIEEGATEGIRGDVAFAQAVLETGGFTNTDSVAANNFSGIGHCDSCAAGWKFASPQLGVRAQIQLLKSYAVKKPNYVLPLVDERLRGPAGCCGTWGDLTTVWATDPTYGPKVMLLYSDLVQFALDRRAAGEGFDVAP